jgi:20S proteasome alpha/beta subunit
VTVCVAAICETSRVICVSDRMLTVYGDWSYEPSTSKVFTLGESFAAMYAGDSSVITEVVQRMGITADDPTRTTDALAHLYSSAYNQVRRTHIDADLLGVYNTTVEGLASGEHKLTPETVKYLRREIKQFRLGDLEVIIAGVDPDGSAHLRFADNGEVHNMDTQGYVAIGSGAAHANARFALAKYSARMSRAEAIVYAYDAKKKADEIVNNVGGETDIRLLGPGSHSSGALFPEDVSKLDELYRNWTLAQRYAIENSIAFVRQMFGGPEPNKSVPTQATAFVTNAALSTAISTAFQPTPPAPDPAKASPIPPESTHRP